MTEFLVDGMLSGTGIRDALNGGYVSPRAIGLSARLSGAIAAWQRKYEEAHFDGFPVDVVATLDKEGLVLASYAQAELNINIGYFSSGRMERLS